MRLKLPSLGFAFALLLLISTSSAQTRGVGFGAYAQGGNEGEQGGLNAKLFINSRNAFDLSVSFSTDPFGNSMGAYVSYLAHFWNALPVPQGKMPLYIGPNGGVGVWEDYWDNRGNIIHNGENGSAIRGGMVAGMAYCFPSGTVPLDIYLQLNPTLEYRFRPGDNNDGFRTDFFIQLGVRYFFGG